MRTKKVPLRQSIDTLKSEIEFRRKLAKQHVTGEILLPDYYKKEDHDRILLERINTTKNKMEVLLNQGVNFSPFLELGAERGQRSLVLTNDFNADGFAADISYHQLKTMNHFSNLFHRGKLPLRICCDANQLPFKTNSISFVFSYEFLHHFPSPKPVVKEIYRVLANGYYFFDEEPLKILLKIVLYRRKNKIYTEKELRKNKYVKLLENYISEGYTDEEEHGIIENENISLKEWIDILSIFKEKDVELTSWEKKTKLSNRLSFRHWKHILFGGKICGLCHKSLEEDKRIRTASELYDILGCPNCIIELPNSDFDRPALNIKGELLVCEKCRFEFPIIEGIAVLLPKEELQRLYPDFI